MLTIEDLRNPKRKSGFDHVGSGNPGSPRPNKYWRSEGGTKTKGSPGWHGKSRQDPKEAAQDYCDYINSGKAPTPKAPIAVKPLARMLNSANHPQRPQHPTARPTTLRPPLSPRVADRNGFVYLIGVQGHANYVKVGWSARNGYPRLAELQPGNALLLVGVAEIPGTLKDEYNLHVRYEPDNVLGEWFLASPELVAEFDLTWTTFCAKVQDLYAIDLETT